MKGKLGKFGLIFLALALCLSISGAAFALWDKTVYIDGTVNTGEVNAIMSVGNCSDDELENKNYSSISCMLDPSDNQTLLVTITDAYPSINYTCEFDITNTGTVPVKINAINVTGDVPGTVNVTGIAVGDQIDPPDSAYGTVTVHLTNAAEELAEHNFSVAIWLVQWNEYPY